MKKSAPILAITWKGRMLVSIIRFFLFWIALFKGRRWQYPISEFEENPRYFKIKDSIYLAYKYYYSIIAKADRDSGIEEYFSGQEFKYPPAASDLTISIGGDLMPYKSMNRVTCCSLWDKCGAFFFSSDIVFANLETPIDVTRKPSLVPEVMMKEMLFNGNEEIFDVFNGFGSYKGFDVLAVANNHSLDQGEEGLMRTLNFLEKKNIRYAGAALTKDALHDFPIINKNGISTAFIAFTFSLNKFDLPEGGDWKCNYIRLNKPDVDITPIVEQARIARLRGAHVVIASLHIGNAYQPYPGKHTMDTIHRICSVAGIDVVIAGHPHNVQPIEWFDYEDVNFKRRRSLIFYSLGDFVAYDIYTLSHFSLLVKLHIKKTEDQAVVSGFEIFPACLLPVFNDNKIDCLVFKHLDEVLLEKRNTPNYISTHLTMIKQFYNQLFTPAQRKQIISKP